MCIEKYSGDPFVGLGGFSKCALKFGFCHLSPWVMPETGDPRHPSSFKPQKTPAPLPHTANLSHGEQKGGGHSEQKHSVGAPPE